FIIQEGEVEVFKAGQGGEEIILAKVGPTNSIGEFAMLDRQPRSASARALTSVTAARVSAEAYDQLLNDLPDWAVSVMRALVERVRHTNEIVRALQKRIQAGTVSPALNQAAQSALDSAEFSDTSGLNKVGGGDGDGTFTQFDFSVYDSPAPNDPSKK
ncbi:MAG: Crp/Fnr family transcriptional regulator, partial [Bdellovibrionales bacterium]|nr:Crp/Fnr family transcriptional regulator [Bdellovibrionales bacterium]